MKPFNFRSVLPSSVILTLTGIVGLGILVILTLPTLGPRWLFFFFVVVAVTGLFIPITYFLNLRFPSTPPVGFQQILREALIIGVYIGLLAWLQLGRVLTTVVGLILAIVAIITEVLIRLRERSRWKPQA